MLKRRSFLQGSSAALYLASGSAALPLFLENAAAQVGPLGGAEAVGYACDAYEKYKLDEDIKKQSEKLDNISAKLTNLGTTMKKVLAEIRLISDREQQLLDRQDLKHIFQSIDIQEGDILKYAYARLGGDTNDYRQQLTDAEKTQLENRAALMKIENGYGPNVYPYIARSFISQALALRILGGSEHYFNTCRDETAGVLQADAAAYDDFVGKAQDRLNNSRDEWNRNTQTVYVGGTCEWHCYDGRVEFSGGSFESGKLPHTKLIISTRKHDQDTWNIGGLPTSEYLRYRNGPYEEDQLDNRRDAILDNLKDVLRDAAKASAQMQDYRKHAAQVRECAVKIGAMQYMPPAPPPPPKKKGWFW
jgi:hypothetical protein